LESLHHFVAAKIDAAAGRYESFGGNLDTFKTLRHHRGGLSGVIRAGVRRAGRFCLLPA
jgi:hypothetical protein